METKTARKELLGIDQTRLVHVDDAEESRRFGDVGVDALEELLHRRRVHQREELLQVQGAAVAGGAHDLSRVAHQELLAVQLGAHQHGVDEDARHHVHEAHGAESDVDHVQPREAPGDPVAEGPHQVVPVDAAGDGHEERQHRQGQAAVEVDQALLHLSVQLASDASFRDHLRQEESYHVDHQQQQDTRPEEAPHGDDDGRDEGAQLPEHPRNPRHPHNPYHLQQLQHTCEAEVLRHCIHTGHSSNFIYELHPDNDEVEQIPLPLSPEEEGLGADHKKPRRDLQGEEQAEDGLGDAEAERGHGDLFIRHGIDDEPEHDRVHEDKHSDDHVHDWVTQAAGEEALQPPEAPHGLHAGRGVADLPAVAGAAEGESPRR
mmetsp:Transcript_67458/g.173735  ORF Transcript_67458/g.173735 Transcript_67458/m.173735 type:complete len:375 (-) Transcript_67458:380-1504(-)